jgi:type II secretory pathway component PulF
LLQQADGSMKQILNTLQNHLRRGDTLTSGLQEYEYIFGPVYINLIRTGEASGNLQENLRQLVIQMEKDYEVRRKVRGALIYPSIIVASAVAISVGIVVFVLPNITQIFESLDVSLPLPTRILLGVSAFIEANGLLATLIAIGVIIAVVILWQIPFLKPFFHKMLLKFPIVGGFAKKTNLARMNRLLSVMLRSGVAIDEAITLTKTVIKNVPYKRMLEQAQAEIAEGRNMTEVFRRYPSLVPPMVMRVVNAGEQAGTLDDMLEYMAVFYEKELDDAMQNLSSILEPVLLIFIGLLVGGLALAVLMPVYQVVGTF